MNPSITNLLNDWSGMFPFQQLWILGPLVVWSLIWKGWALWKAAQAGRKSWFIVLLIVNTVGILDILYVYIFSKSKSLKSGPMVVEIK